MEERCCLALYPLQTLPHLTVNWNEQFYSPFQWWREKMWSHSAIFLSACCCPEHWFLSMSVWFKTHTVQVSSCKVKMCSHHWFIHYFPLSRVCLKHMFWQGRCIKKQPDIIRFTVFHIKLPLSRLHHFHFPSPAGSRLFPELSSVGHTEEKSAVGICCVSDSGRGSGAVARLSGRSALCSL